MARSIPPVAKVHGAVSLGVKLASATAAICTVLTFAWDWGIAGTSTRRSVGTFGAAWVGLAPAVDTLTSLGDTVHLAATVTDRHGVAIVGLAVRWSVDHADVATVNSDGTVVAQAPGSATVLITVGDLVARAAVVVRPRTAYVHIATDSAITIAEGTTRAVSVRATDARGHVLEPVVARWQSADSSVATVDSTGVVRARGAGETTLTATIDGIAAAAPVTVTAVPATLVAIAGGGQHAEAGAVLPQPVVVRLLSYRGRPLAGAPVHFRRVDPLATVEIGQATSDADGRARLAWRLSDRPGRQHLVVTTDGLDSALTIVAESDPVAADTRASILADSQSARAGTALATPIGIRLSDSAGRLLPDVPIAWVPTDGARVASGASRTDSLGEARATWTLGPRAGPQRLRIVIGDGRAVRPAIAHARAAAGPPATLRAVSGDAQRARAGTTLPRAIALRVADPAGNPAAGVRVRFVASQGTLSDTIVVSDSAGVARTHWTLGAAVGTQHVVAKADGVADRVTCSATAAPASRTRHH